MLNQLNIFKQEFEMCKRALSLAMLVAVCHKGESSNDRRRSSQYRAFVPAHTLRSSC